MGGGDLNMKKSWHPVLLVNQERVWKAEKSANEEKKMLAQLRKEREEERQLAELQRLQEATTGKKRVDKMDWMYAAPGNEGGALGGQKLGEREMEEYLLGKKRVDEVLGRGDKDVGATHKDFIAVQNANNPRDMASKIREDPLLAIKKQEQAALAALMNRPDIRKQLKAAKKEQKETKEEKEERRAKKKADKEERRARKHDRHGHESRRDRDRSPRSDYSDDYYRDKRSHRRDSYDRDREERRRRDHDRDRSRSRSISPKRERDGRGYSRDDSSTRRHRDERSPRRDSDRRRDDRDRNEYRRRDDDRHSVKREDDRDSGRRDSGERDDPRIPPPRNFPTNGHSSDTRDIKPFNRPPRPSALDMADQPTSSLSSSSRRPPPPSNGHSNGNTNGQSLDEMRAARLAAMQSSANEIYDQRTKTLAERAEKDRLETERDEKLRSKYGQEQATAGFFKQQTGMNLSESLQRRAGKGLLRDI